jgi:hypothetical protein
MNAKTTWGLVLLAAGLFAFIFFYERKLPDVDAGAQAPARLLPDFSAPRITSIEIIRSNQVIRVERTNGAWWLSNPDYPAQPLRIEKLLTVLQALPPKAVLSAEESAQRPQAATEYGLTPPQADVVLRQADGRIELRLGCKTLVGDQVYLQLVGTPGIFFADTVLWNSLPGSAHDWRDTTFLNLKGFEFDRLEVRAADPYGFELLLNPSNRLWRLTKPTPARADTTKVNLLLEQLQSAQISRFLAETSSLDPEASGFQAAGGVEVAFLQGTNTRSVVQFGKNPTNDPSVVYARTLSRTNVVLVPSELVAQLRVSFREFQDRRLVSFSPAEVSLIEVRGREYFALERQTNATWRFVTPTNKEADPSLVEEFLTRLGELGIVGFEKDVVTDQDFAARGFAPPARQYTLKTTHTTAAGTTNELLAQIDFGTNTVDKVYARRADENSLYAVSLYASQQLPSASYQLRNRSLWSFPPTDVASLTIYRQGQTRKITRNTAKEWVLAPVFQGLLQPLVVDLLLEELGKLRAQAWVAQGEETASRFGFAIIPHRLTLGIVTADQPVTLQVEFGGMAPSGNVYASTLVDGQLTVFEFPGTVYSELYEVLAHDLFEPTRAAASQ